MMSASSFYLKAVYALWAHVYERFLEPVFSFDRERVVAQVPEGKVLELAVGVGLDLPYFTEKHDVTGVDFSKAMLRRARKSFPEADLVHADARDLPFENDTFDAALATFFFRVLPDPKPALLEAARVVKPGGTLVMADHFTETHDWLAWLTIPLGWGKDRTVDSLLEGTPWTVESDEELGTRKTRLLVLTNRGSKR